MIFLSHNYNDKILVEPVALKLREIFGVENVFYDSWSIQPGDGIVDKMNSGLEKCKFFFLFVSKNSLDSNMVKLEWQNALFKSVRGELRIIPVRLDSSLIPSILMQTLYLDIYTNGLNTVITQMMSVIRGTNTFAPINSGFHNLKATIITKLDKYEIDIESIHFMEPHAQFLILLSNLQQDFEIGLRGNGMISTGFASNVTLNNGVTGNGWILGVTQALVPSFPLEVQLIKKNPSISANILGILHEHEKDKWISIPYQMK